MKLKDILFENNSEVIYENLLAIKAIKNSVDRAAKNSTGGAINTSAFSDSNAAVQDNFFKKVQVDATAKEIIKEVVSILLPKIQKAIDEVIKRYSAMSGGGRFSPESVVYDLSKYNPKSFEQEVVKDADRELTILAKDLTPGFFKSLISTPKIAKTELINKIVAKLKPADYIEGTVNAIVNAARG
jgi:hypothetical protein